MRHNDTTSHTEVRRHVHRITILMLMVSLAIAAISLSAAAHSQPATSAGRVIEVKFRGGRVRLRNGVPVDEMQPALANAQSSTRLQQIGSWSRAHSVDEGDLDLLRDRAVQNSGQPVPDLNLYFRVTLPSGADSNQALRDLSQLPNVEGAYLVPQPAPLPTAPDFSNALFDQFSYQRYLDSAPDGIGVRDVSAIKGAHATGVAICDVEYNWNAAHTDLPPVMLRGPTPVDPFPTFPNTDNHGTAVLGVLGSKHNGSGTTGIASGASISFAGAQTVDGYNAGAAIIACANTLAAGDVIIIEQQIYGPRHIVTDCADCVPVEWYKPTYDAIKVAVARGIVVVEAAANGAEDLDDPIYTTGNNGHYPFLPANDSGAIIVGAGRSAFAASFARLAHVFSDYGATVDLQGWGDQVTTSGYGDLYAAEGKDTWFTAVFNGTSSATAIVAGAVAVVQGVYKTRFGAPATPATIRRLLQSTGTPQIGAHHIGPLPNLRCALDSLLPLKLEGASTAMLGTSVPFTATITAADVTLPLTYTWQIDNGAPITVTGELSTVLNPVWDTSGTHTVTLQVRSGCGEPATITRTVQVIGVSPISAVVDGRLRVTLGSTSSYTASIAPMNTEQPITYTWQAAGQPQITHTAGLSDTIAITWDSAGTHILTATITNGWESPLVVTKTIVVGTPVLRATLDGPDTATLGATSSFTAIVSPPETTLPVSYTWQLDADPPVQHTGDLSDTFPVRWSQVGAHVLKVTMSNGFGTPYSISKAMPIETSILVAVFEGPPTPTVGETSNYTITVHTLATNRPISYTWQLDDSPPIHHSGGTSDVLAVHWLRDGPHVLRVTVTDGLSEPFRMEQIITVAQRTFPIYLPRITR